MEKKLSVNISPEYANPYAVIYTNQVTEEVQRMIDAFSTNETPITALRDEDMVILQPTEIYMVRVEGGETIIYGAKQTYRSKKRLYEIGQQLGSKFMQISKTTFVNLSYMDSIEPGLSTSPNCNALQLYSMKRLSHLSQNSNLLLKFLNLIL